MNTFETVIGLEVHLQLNTDTKIFCGCGNIFGQAPNAQTCPVCLGLPGTLPVLNKKALFYAMKIAMALNCQISPYIKFDRKNYYYPDLPKGYQISQYDFPIAKNGFLMVNAHGDLKKIGITRAHLEEDAGKLIHDTAVNCSLVDYNRTGTPLMEIVSEPDMRTPQQAHDYLTALKLTLQYLDISDCDMEKGSLRCDANVSVRKMGDAKLGTKVEIKNMNSFKAVKSALEFEEIRQQKMIAAGERISQETRLWSEEKQATFAMRSKEEAHDYRYFPEPDLVPFIVEQKIIDEIAHSLPELPLQKLERFISRYNLSSYDAGILIQDKHLAEFFEGCAQLYSENITPVSSIKNNKENRDNTDHTHILKGVSKKITNWIIGPLQQELNSRKSDINTIELKLEDFVKLIALVESGSVSNLVGKDVLKFMLDSGKGPEAIIAEQGLAQVSDTGALEKIVDEILNEHAQIANQVKEGKESAIGFLVGQSMRKTHGKANPKLLGEIIKRRLLNG